MADKLADFVVGIGVKGQNVALTEINKVKKAGKELSKQKNKVNFQNVRAEINARKQLDNIKRQTQATRGQVELQKMQQQKQAQAMQHVSNAGAGARNALGTAMTSGATGLASSIPGVGALFGAASSAVELAGQEYIAGVTASKNMRLVTNNYARAFQGAFTQGVNNAVGASTGVFAGRSGAAFATSLADQGVGANTLEKTLPALNQLANSQGVGSIDELMGRLQSGTLKENAGLSKADIVLLQSQSQLLNNRFTSDIGAQMIAQTLQRVSPGMQRAAAQTSGLTAMAGAESHLRDREENFRAEGANMGAGAVDSMYNARRTDRDVRRTLLPLSTAINNIPGQIINRGRRIGTAVSEGRYMDAAQETLGMFNPAFSNINDLQRQQNQGTGSAPGGGGEMPEGGGAPTSGEGASAGPLSMQADTINNEILRSGRAIADTLTQINNQLNVTRAQLRRA